MADAAAVIEAEEIAGIPYDTSDPKQVNASRKTAARLHRDRLNVVGALMEQPAGRAWLYFHLKACHVFEMSFVRGDQHATAFNEGERNQGNRLLGDIQQAAPELYPAMIAEGKKLYG